MKISVTNLARLMVEAYETNPDNDWCINTVRLVHPKADVELLDNIWQGIDAHAQESRPHSIKLTKALTEAGRELDNASMQAQNREWCDHYEGYARMCRDAVKFSGTLNIKG